MGEPVTSFQSTVYKYIDHVITVQSPSFFLMPNQVKEKILQTVDGSDWYSNSSKTEYGIDTWSRAQDLRNYVFYFLREIIIRMRKHKK